MDFKNKRIAIIGIGIEGLSSAEFLVKKGGIITLLDQKKESDVDKEILAKIKDRKYKFSFGENYLDNLNNFDLIVRSPGVRFDLPQLEKAKEKGIQVTSQTKLFFDLCPCLIIGVTGTKGKGTTSSLIYEILKESFGSAQDRQVFLGGNIGEPPLSFLDKLTSSSRVVLELSSFQLQDIGSSPADAKAMAGKPHIAVMLMVTSEHLDYHKDIAEYIDAKRNILRFQEPSDFAVLNRDYLASLESDIYTNAKVLRVSREREVDEGSFVKDQKIYFRLNGRDEKIIDTAEILLPGAHNFENVSAAIVAAKLAGVSTSSIVKVLRTFKGLEHRLQLVKIVDEVRYYDDSFSTTPEPAIAAIEAFDVPEILILGGSSKKADFTELGRVISHSKNVKAIIGIGEEWKRIKAQLKIKNLKLKIIEGCRNMKQIVLEAREMADPGDVVLLSPACASFGMFKNYKDRGEQFKREVNKLI